MVAEMSIVENGICKRGNCIGCGNEWCRLVEGCRSDELVYSFLAVE